MKIHHKQKYVCARLYISDKVLQVAQLTLQLYTNIHPVQKFIPSLMRKAVRVRQGREGIHRDCLNEVCERDGGRFTTLRSWKAEKCVLERLRVVRIFFFTGITTRNTRF